MGYQCVPSRGLCMPVTTVTYDPNFPLHDSVQACRRQCGTYYAANSYGRYGGYAGGDLDVNPGPKKAPKSFSD